MEEEVEISHHQKEIDAAIAEDNSESTRNERGERIADHFRCITVKLVRILYQTILLTYFFFLLKGIILRYNAIMVSTTDS